jgi:general secretion pathway protein G
MREALDPGVRRGDSRCGLRRDGAIRPAQARTGRAAGGRGFTLIELVVVMSVIALLLTLAVPRYFQSLDNARINVQRQNVAAIREAIDKFYGDQGRYPNALSELVEKRYMRAVPLDPISESSDWVVIAPQDTTLGAVYDVRPPPVAPGEPRS